MICPNCIAKIHVITIRIHGSLSSSLSSKLAGGDAYHECLGFVMIICQDLQTKIQFDMKKQKS